VHTDN